MRPALLGAQVVDRQRPYRFAETASSDSTAVPLTRAHLWGVSAVATHSATLGSRRTFRALTDDSSTAITTAASSERCHTGVIWGDPSGRTVLRTEMTGS